MRIEELTAQTILNDDVFDELLSIRDEIERERCIFYLTDRAKLLGIKLKFEKLLSIHLKKEKQALKESSRAVVVRNDNQFIEFENMPYELPSLFNGGWFTDDSGIRTIGMFGEIIACYHPLLPIQRLVNIETGKEKVTIAFKKNSRWREITIDKGVIASTTKIVQLSDYGIAVTSENAKYLVKYLSDIENINIEFLPEKKSTSKMGWLGKQFRPYTDEVEFDGNDKFKDCYEAVQEHGSYSKWIDEIKRVREYGTQEPLFMMAASFASPIVKLLNIYPFFCNLWGDTEGGKTVSLMCACSIWASPEENKYISTFNNTDVALELKSNFLNNLPLMIDDTATIKRNMKGQGFGHLIYSLCSGKGRGRGTKDLGISQETTWRNTILTNGEHPLSSENMEAGALNRLLDLKCQHDKFFEDGNRTVGIITQNYGFAGKIFIDILNEIGVDKIREIQEHFYKMVKNGDNMAKQSVALSVVLMADKIATDYIFKDGIYLDYLKLKGVLVSKEELSEHIRCYDYMLDIAAVNTNKFQPNINGDYSGEIWGKVDNEAVYIINTVFDKLCADMHFSRKGFLNWAENEGVLIQQGEKNTCVIKIMQKNQRCIGIRFERPVKEAHNNNEFIEIPDDQTGDLPF